MLVVFGLESIGLLGLICTKGAIIHDYAYVSSSLTPNRLTMSMVWSGMVGDYKHTSFTIPVSYLLTRNVISIAV